ncbi:polycystic kidney disease 1-like 2 [Octopus vulgaris]|uniref:Polycystic kidney disease 1-like 2 n=1 Tax=Octopus vulgaris TaxID=6645 RepID=A0AA36AP43_OCTVU|nr:polycystic kidney disease 1-like 2 [Octopus vulgaris]
MLSSIQSNTVDSITQTNKVTILTTAHSIIHQKSVERRQLNGVVHIAEGLEWKPELEDEHSEEFQQTSKIVLDMLTTAIKNSQLRDGFVSVRINGFSQGSVNVNFTVVLEENTTEADNTNGSQVNTSLSSEQIGEILIHVLHNASNTGNLTIDVNQTSVIEYHLVTWLPTEISTKQNHVTETLFPTTFEGNITSSGSAIPSTDGLSTSSYSEEELFNASTPRVELSSVQTVALNSSDVTTPPVQINESLPESILLQYNTTITESSLYVDTTIQSYLMTTLEPTYYTSILTPFSSLFLSQTTSSFPLSPPSSLSLSFASSILSLSFLSSPSLSLSSSSPPSSSLILTPQSTLLLSEDQKQTLDVSLESSLYLHTVTNVSNQLNLPSVSTINRSSLFSTVHPVSLTNMLTTQPTSVYFNSSKVDQDISTSQTAHPITYTTENYSDTKTAFSYLETLVTEIIKSLEITSSITSLNNDFSESSFQPALESSYFTQEWSSANLNPSLNQLSVATISTSNSFTTLPTNQMSESLSINSAETGLSTSDDYTISSSQLIADSSESFTDSGSILMSYFENEFATSLLTVIPSITNSKSGQLLTQFTSEDQVILTPSNTIDWTSYTSGKLISSNPSSQFISSLSSNIINFSQEFNASLKLTSGIVWQPELLDKTTSQYKDAELRVWEFINAVFDGSKLAGTIKRIRIHGFREGSVVVDFEVLVNGSSTNEQSIKEEFVTSYNNLNNPEFGIDSQQINFTDSMSLLATHLTSNFYDSSDISTANSLQHQTAVTQEIETSTFSPQVSFTGDKISSFISETLMLTTEQLSVTLPSLSVNPPQDTPSFFISPSQVTPPLSLTHSQAISNTIHSQYTTPDATSFWFETTNEPITSVIKASSLSEVFQSSSRSHYESLSIASNLEGITSSVIESQESSIDYKSNSNISPASQETAADHVPRSTLQNTEANSTEFPLDSSPISLDTTSVVITNAIISQDKSFSSSPTQTDSLDFTTSYSADQYFSSIEAIKSLLSVSTNEIIRTSSLVSLTDAYSSLSMWYSNDVAQTYSSSLISTFAETVGTSSSKAESSLFNLDFSSTSLSADMSSKSQSLLYHSLLPSTMLSVENTPSFIPVTSIVETNGFSSSIFLSILSISSTTSKILSEIFTSSPLQPSDALTHLITKSSNFETQYTENIGSTSNSNNAEGSASLFIQTSSYNPVTSTNISALNILNTESLISHSSILPFTNLKISSLTTYVAESLPSFVSDLHIHSSEYQSIDSFSYVSFLSTNSVSNSPLTTIYMNSKNSLETNLSYLPTNSGLFSLAFQSTTPNIISSTRFQTVEDVSASSVSPVISEGVSQLITDEYFTQSSQYATPIFSRYATSGWELSNSIDSTVEHFERSVSLQTFVDVYSSVFSSQTERTDEYNTTVQNSVSNPDTTLTVLSTVYLNNITNSNDITLSVTVGESGIQSELLNSFENSLQQKSSVNILQSENASESSQLYMEKTLSVNNFLTDSLGSFSSGDTKQLTTLQLTEKTQMTRDFSFQTGSNELMYTSPFTSTDESQQSMTDYLTPSFESNLMSTVVASQPVYETEFSSISIILSINSNINSQPVTSGYLTNKFSTAINTVPYSVGTQQLYASSEFLSKTRIIDSFSDFATLHSENSQNNFKSAEFSSSFRLGSEDFASNTSLSVLEILPTITTTNLPQETKHFTDVDECSNETSCGINSICMNTRGSYQCECKTGYKKVGDICQDVDECATGGHNCPQISTCINTGGSYLCKCFSGYEDVAGNCIDIDECQENICPLHSDCINTEGSYSCQCKLGYYEIRENRCSAIQLFKASIEILELEGTPVTFTNVMNTSTSPSYQTITRHIKSLINENVNQTVAGEHYLDVKNLSVTDGSNVVSVLLYFTPDPALTVNDAAKLLLQANNSQQLQIGFIIGSNETHIFDVNECNIPKIHECSKNAYCNNTVGSYTCTCKGNFNDISSTFLYKPGRICENSTNQFLDPIRSVTLKTKQQVYKTDEIIEFIVTSNQGSHLSYTLNYGDNHSETTVSQSILASQIVFKHSYNDVGTFHVNITAWNDVSSASNTKEILVQRPLPDFHLQIEDVHSKFINIHQKRFLLSFKSTIYQNIVHDINIQWIFDENTAQHDYIANMKSNVSLMIERAFAPGVHNITVICTNQLSSRVLQEIFIINEPISGITVSTEKHYLRPSEIYNLKIETKSGSNITYSVFANGELLKQIFPLNWSTGVTLKNISVVLMAVGHYNICVRASNDEGNVSAQLKIVVLNPVQKLSITVNKKIILPIQDLFISISYHEPSGSPTDVNCLPIVKKIQLRKAYTDMIGINQALEFSRAWPNDLLGNTSITVNCSNALNSQLLSTWVVAQVGITGVNVTADKYFVALDEIVQLKFTVESGSNVFYEYIIYNISTNSSEYLIRKPLQIEVSKSFSFPGGYPVYFQVINDVSAYNTSATIWVLEEVNDLELTHYYSLSDSKQIIRGGHGSLNNTYPLERNITFVATTSKGNRLKYTWNLEKSSEIITEQPSLSHRFTSPGIYRVSVNASNALYYKVSYSDIEIQQIIQIKSFTNDGPKVPTLPIKFTLTFFKVGTNSCFSWDMADGSPYHETCINAPLDSHISSSSQQITHSHIYQINGTFLVRVNVSNSVSVRSVEQLAIISSVSCEYPIVRIQGADRNIDSPKYHLRSDWILLQSTADLVCETTSDADYIWKVERILPGDTYLNRIYTPYKTSSEATYKFRLLFKPLTFELGNYKISLNVSIGNVKGLYSADFSYLAIKASPLVSQIQGGNLRRVGYGKIFRMDAINGSYDPDQHIQVKNSFSFKWMCKIITSENITSTELTNILNNITGGTFTLDSRLLGKNFKGVFKVVASKDSRTATYEQTLQIVDGTPHTLEIRCVVNCKKQVNPSGVLSLTGICVTCREHETVSYKWQLLIKDKFKDSFTEVTTLSEMSTTGTDNAILAMKEGVLLGGHTYRLEFEVQVYGYATSVSGYQFRTNLPPHGGNCTISPTSGYVLTTKFEISCFGWKNSNEDDEGNDESLWYRFFSQPVGGSVKQLLYYGTESYMPRSQFGLGLEKYNYMVNVGVRVSNSMGSYVEIFLQVQVKNPATEKTSQNNFMNKSDEYEQEFSSLLSTGRDQEAKQLVVALASIINTDTFQGKDNTEDSSPEVSNNDLNEKPLNNSETTDSSGEKKEQIIQLRTFAVETLAKTAQPTTLDSLQQTAMAFRVITLEPNELSDKAQSITISAMESIADTMETMVSDSHIIVSLTNVLQSIDIENDIATKEDVKIDSDEQKATNEKESDEKEENANRNWKPIHEAITDKTRNITNAAIKITDKIIRSVLANRMPGEPAVKLESKLFTILGERKTPNGLNNSVLGSGCVKLPDVDNLLPNGLKDKFVDTKFLRAKSNPYRWDPTSMYINSDVVSLDLYSSDGSTIQVSNISQDISFDIEVKYDSPLSSVTLNSTFNKSISIHSLEVPTVENSLLLLVKPESANVSLDVLIRHKLPPTDTEYDLFFTVPIQPSNDKNTSNSDYTVFVTSEQVKQLGNGTYFIGIRPFSELTEQSVDDYYDALEMAPAEMAQENITADPFPSYQFRFIVSGCRFWDVKQEKWLTKGCRVSPESTRKYTRCLCNHLTSFGADFIVPVNKINFDTVFLNLDEKIKDNFAVLAMLCSVFSLYFMLIIWARRQDKRDLLKWGVVPLKSNKANDCYFYTITVFTGVRKGAGTLSRIGFVLTGELGDTGIRQLVDEKESKVFSRGSINSYLLGVPKSLGPLTYLRIWHDASGKGEHESWYLRKIVILSLITSLLLKKPEEENYEEKKGQERLDGAKSPIGNDQIGVRIVTDLHNDEELVDYQPEKESINATPIYTPNKEALEKLRQNRLTDIKMKQLIKDMCFYLTYLVLLIILASNNRDPRSYIIKDTLLNVLQAKHLPKVIRYAQFWKWAKGVVVPQTYTSTLANGKNATPQDFQMLSCGAGYRVGPVRLRQLRVRAGKCHTLSKFYTTRENCNRDYSFHTEDTTNYTTSWKELQHGDKPIKLPLNSGWRYRHYTEIGGIPIVGEKAVYSSNGYCKDLTGSPSRAMAALDELIKLRWLDNNTRAIFVEFTLYNPNINMFTTVTVMFETPTLGGMASNVIINTFRLYPYTGNYGIFILVVEIICVIFIIIFIEQKIQTVRHLQRKCFGDFWNVLQILNLCFSIIATTTYVMRHLFTISAIKTVKKLRGDFYNFQQLSFWSDVFTIFLALAVFLTILNVIHLLRFNRRMSMLSQTLRQSSKDLFAFSFVFAVLFFSYACVGYLLFGKVITSYSSISISIMTLFMSILGQYQYESVQAVNRILGPMYFFSCTMLVNFILFSVFITILNESFSLVRSNISKQINDYEIINYLHEYVTKWIGTDHDHLFNKLLNKKTDIEVTCVTDSTNKMNKPNEEAHEKENIDLKIQDIFKRLDTLYLQIEAQRH